MSEQHKDALARGRVQGRVVRDYLTALEAGRRPGRRVDRAAIEHRITGIQDRIDTQDDPATRVTLLEQRLELEHRLVALDAEPDLDALEDEFVAVAAEYSQRKGISYTAWREIGVPAAVLERAGITRAGSPT